MGYRVKPIKNKKSDPKYKIQYRSYKGRRHEQDIHRSKWYQHGFSADMSMAEAKERARQLNAQEKLKREHEARAAIDKRLRKEDEIKCAYLPPLLVQEFKDRRLFRGLRGDPVKIQESRLNSHWRAAKRVIREIRIDPSDWDDEFEAFYDYFERNEWSISYVEKVLQILNQWGYFCCKKQNSAFLPIPSPKGRSRQRIADSYYESDKITKESDGITPGQLNKAKSSLMEEHYNWLFISLWFGLRPGEIDSLHRDDGRSWQIAVEKGFKVLKIYQGKLTSVDRDKRWKLIPCLMPEQEEALRLIQGKVFKRPLVKTIKMHVNSIANTYGGRKGFTNLLLEKGYAFEAISSYLGHQSIDRTWKNYRDKNKVMLPDGHQNLIPLKKKAAI